MSLLFSINLTAFIKVLKNFNFHFFCRFKILSNRDTSLISNFIIKQYFEHNADASEDLLIFSYVSGYNDTVTL